MIPLWVPFLPASYFRLVWGASQVSHHSGRRFKVWAPKTPKLSFSSPSLQDVVFFRIDCEPGFCYEFCFFLQVTLGLFEVRVRFHSVRVSGLQFELPKPPKLSFSSLSIQKVVFFGIACESGFPFEFHFFLYLTLGLFEVRVMFHNVRVGSLQFELPKPQNLVFSIRSL